MNFPLAIKGGKLQARVYKVAGYNKGKWVDYGYIFAYGEPYGDSVQVDYGKGPVTVRRYLGRAGYTSTDNGGDYTNIAFPYDAKVTWTFPKLYKKGTMLETPWATKEYRDKIRNQLGQTLNKSADTAFYGPGHEEAKQKLIEQIKSASNLFIQT